MIIGLLILNVGIWGLLLVTAIGAIISCFRD